MTFFLVATGTLLALALAFILVPLMRGARRGASTDRSAVNVAVYRDHLAELDREEEGVIVATLDLQQIRRHRAAFGFFRDRRPELYGRLVQDI